MVTLYHFKKNTLEKTFVILLVKLFFDVKLKGASLLAQW